MKTSLMWTFSSLLLLGAVASAQMPVAEPPRTSLDTIWNPPAGGKTWTVHTTEEFQNALKASIPGDIIVLDAGKSYTGNFQLPPKANPSHKWIYIESSSMDKMAAGKRVSPSDAANMPKIVTPNVTAAVSANGGSSYWRLAGLEITTASAQGCNPKHSPPANCFSYVLIDTPSSSAGLSDSITVDRCFIHASPDLDVQHAIVANSTNFSLVDSYVSDIHMAGSESQAVLAYHTPGPLKVVNNFLESAGENMMLGGAGGPNNPYVPSDIEVRNNYLFKPLSWVPLSLDGHMVVKNAFEIKSGQRVLFSGNTIENVWRAGQNGFAIVLTVRSSQSGDVAVVNDITVTNNVLKNVTAGVNTLAWDDQCGNSTYYKCTNPGGQDRWNISNNLITFYDPKIPGGFRNLGIGIQVGTANRPGLKNVVWQHNTLVSAASAPCWNSIYFATPSAPPPWKNPASNIWILDNVLCRPPSGDWGLQGTSGLTQYMGIPAPVENRFVGNLVYVPFDSKPSSFPPRNLVTSSTLRYVNPAEGNFALVQAKAPQTTDGKPPGVDSAVLPAPGPK